jgi:hypothetical protein
VVPSDRPASRALSLKGGNARFLLRPRWLLSHLLVAADLRRQPGLYGCAGWTGGAGNGLIESHSQPVTPVDNGGPAPAMQRWAKRYRGDGHGTDDEATVVVRNRTQDGVAGAWLVTRWRCPPASRWG